MANILVVDDEVGVCCVIQHLLVREGYAVTAVTDGRLAMDAVTRGDFAAALIDLNLADMDGNDVIRAARAARPNMPIVLMSGLVLESGRGTPDFLGLSAKVSGLHRLAKPFKPRDLAQLMRDILPHDADSLAVATMLRQ
ncbi:response regulator [Bradyrhizobium ontarionense]|uniref:Response regulator n=1 Tax=Bradyrhizobium ontarionense TaxID=2898149 RepID=A0ABY3RER8_9BRAD|nr:response regulator [Bradyrhizobium sp. A19]UFZ05796.1 response regulator [Bradyrhizobium sp. A19]